MDIAIIKDNYGALFAYEKENDVFPLFQFGYRADGDDAGWCFWSREKSWPTIIKGGEKDFPMEHFKKLCRATAFALWNCDLDQEVIIVKGGKYIGLK